MRIHFLKAVGLLLAGASSLAFATTCDSALYDFSVSYSGYPGTQADIAANNPECFAGSRATSNTQINATAFTQATAISRAIASRLILLSGDEIANAGTAPGLAAGDTPQAWNTWGNINQNDSSFRYTAPNASKTRGVNDIFTSVVGTDYALTPNMVVGVSVASDNGDGWGQNGVAVKNKNSTDGYLIAPYLGYQLSKEWALDVSAGLGSGDFSATGGVSANADRWFTAANFTYTGWMGNWQFTGKASYLHGVEDYDNMRVNGLRIAATDIRNTLDQIRLGAQAGYWMNGVMPYAGLSFTSNDYRDDEAGYDILGQDALVATLGINFYSLSSKVSGGIFYEEELGRLHSDNKLISANINFRF
jgi:hypothetical protein